MKNKLVYLIYFLAINLSAQVPPTDYTDAFRLIEGWMEAQKDYQHLPSVSAAIVNDQEMIWSKAFGQTISEMNHPITPSTIYSICSISKLFTAVAIMQLYDEGKLRLDDEIKTLLPSFDLKKTFPESGPITIRSLLTHSSGLPRESDFPYWTGPDFPFPTASQVNARLGSQDMLYPASTNFQYSNLGITLLGQVVEKLSGKSYDDYVKDRILKPLKLNATHPNLPKEEWGKKMAIGYSAIKRDGSRDQIPLFDAKGIKAAAGYASTVEDLARFASWQFRLLTNGGTELIKASTLREMQRVQWTDPDWKTTWGLGFVVSQQGNTTIVSHGGSCPGYRATLQMDPKSKMAYTVMINAGGESPELFAKELREIMNKIPKSKARVNENINLDEYTGSYLIQPWGSEQIILPWYGDLAILRLPNTNPDESMTILRQVSGNEFRELKGDELIGGVYRFEKNASGKVIKMWTHSNSAAKIN
ncbi:MAG: serine hydrolase domain-containing protein [Saprospiraceae bacterium]|nr:serine hydrolase domain-containing protein [Saprospiraceae bacterium]